LKTESNHSNNSGIDCSLLKMGITILNSGLVMLQRTCKKLVLLPSKLQFEFISF
jgi:hypothetical protein